MGYYRKGIRVGGNAISDAIKRETRAAVLPMVIGTGAISLLALIIALRK